MSKLEWLRSLVEEVNQKHQKQNRPLQSLQESSLQSQTLPHQPLKDQSLHNSLAETDFSESDELENIFSQDLRGIIEPSKAYRHIQIYEAKQYAFYETYPTFDRLNLNQLKWYLYWRKLVQTGIYTDAREGYLFLYAFELLNLSFEPEPQKAAEMLIELYEGYKERVPRIAAILPAWIGDMYTEFGQPEMAVSWYEKITPQKYDTSVFETYELAGLAPPFSVWKPLLSEQTAFYRKHMEELDMCFAILMEPLDHYFQKKRKKTLLEVVLPEKWVIEQARFYDWAVIERAVPFRRKISYSPHYRGRSSTLDILVACLRYLENHFRGEAGNRLLKVKDSLLAKPLKLLLDQVFEEYRVKYPRLQRQQFVDMQHNHMLEPEKVKIDVDPSLVETLHDESNWVRDTILSILDPLDSDELQTEEERMENEFGVDEVFLQQVFAPTTGVDELEGAWQDFLKMLTDVEHAFIMWWLDQAILQRSTEEIQEFLRLRSMMMHPVLDAINEKALDGLGDILFELASDEVYWNEEFAAIVNG